VVAKDHAYLETARTRRTILPGRRLSRMIIRVPRSRSVARAVNTHPFPAAHRPTRRRRRRRPVASCAACVFLIRARWLFTRAFGRSEKIRGKTARARFNKKKIKIVTPFLRYIAVCLLNPTTVIVGRMFGGHVD